MNLLIRKNILFQNNEFIFSKTHKKMFNARREEKMFTRMSKGVLWVLVAAVVIGGFVGMAEEVGIGLLIWLGGLVLIWGLGVFVELINNILDIKKILQSISSTGSMGNSNVGSYGSMGYNMNTSKQSGWNETTWYCNHCGTPNSSDATRCAGCGTLRPNSGKPSLASAAAQMGNSRETQTGWYCRYCGSKNNATSRVCIGCGKDK